MLDDYSVNQNLAYSLVSKFLNKDKIIHAYLINGNDFVDSFGFALALAKSIICGKHFTNLSSNCGSCNICQRIDNGNYPELKIIDTDSLIIKKEQLLELQNDFSLASIEGNCRVYIIKDAEKMNKQASNSLLKFLEEPNDGIVAILLTNNINSLLSTIISRCQVINLVNDDKLSNESTLINFAHLCSDSTDSIKSFLDDSSNIEFLDSILYFLVYFEENGMDILLLSKKLWYNIYKSREEVVRGFLLIINFYYDVLKYKVGVNNFFFCDRIDIISNISNFNSIELIIEKINIFSYGYDMVKSNLNINLLMDDIIIKIGDLCGNS